MADEVCKLKRELDGEIVVYASNQLARTLIENDQVDELRAGRLPGRPRRRRAPTDGSSSATRGHRRRGS